MTIHYDYKPEDIFRGTHPCSARLYRDTEVRRSCHSRKRFFSPRISNAGVNFLGSFASGARVNDPKDIEHSVIAPRATNRLRNDIRSGPDRL